MRCRRTARRYVAKPWRRNTRADDPVAAHDTTASSTARKIIVALFAIAFIVLAVAAVPWRVGPDKSGHVRADAYAPLWRPPLTDHRLAVVDYPRLAVGLIALTVVFLAAIYVARRPPHPHVQAWNSGNALPRAQKPQLAFGRRVHAAVGMTVGLVIGAGFGFVYGYVLLGAITISIIGSVVSAMIWWMPASNDARSVMVAGIVGGATSGSISHTLITGVYDGLAADTMLGSVFLGSVCGGIIAAPFALVAAAVACIRRSPSDIKQTANVEI